MKKILFIDNHDSFVFNIVELCRETLKRPLEIVSIDEASMVLDRLGDYAGIIISPGPGLPKDRPIINEVIKKATEGKAIPTLGVCLGHQAIAEYYGGRLYRLESPKHGHASTLKISTESKILSGVTEQDKVGRYHSWAVCEEAFPGELHITARSSDDNVIMAFEHNTLPIAGVQFHPESIISTCGSLIIRNWSGLLEE